GRWRGGGAAHAGGGAQDRQQQPQAVYDDMALAAVDVLGVVPAAGLPAGAAVHRLAVDAGGAARPPRLLLLADAVAELIVDGLQGAVVPPLVEVAPNGTLGREVLGQVAPLAAGAHDGEEGGHDVAHRGRSGPPPRGPQD